ncbi:ABC transporter G family member 49 [Hondaea fermentalgiana]|uniref:ABC transporter G family member 49 n=1 Tax=Hondaea fermentalgiana TaxID=2315210 RepID=A0A2R5GSF7_9STRA|nr:ABC transporter G family member 49 [Hondaea fermentalgiana]|eukprot:GBG33780.1 ABC transporter G family member 49 [Hondaea fermentalgiana]
MLPPRKPSATEANSSWGSWLPTFAQWRTSSTEGDAGSSWLTKWWNGEDTEGGMEGRPHSTPREEQAESKSLRTSVVTDTSVYLHSEPSSVFEPFNGEPRLPITVSMTNVSFTAKVAHKDTNLRTVYTVFRDALRLCKRTETQDLHILNDISLSLQPGTSTLLLGAPGSGKSSLLHLLAGRLKTGRGTSFSGSITYNKVDQSNLEMTKVATLVGQIDEHLPLQTVREIFDFANCTMGSSQAFTRKSGKGIPKGSSEEDVRKALKFAVDDMLSLLGLSGAANTIIGNELFRGVSGGERKRTTLGEMLFGRHPLLLLDEITTGLDSATAFKVVQTLNAATRSMQSIAVISLLQPGPELVKLFDDIILMCEGLVIYHGPVRGVLKYFASLGFTCASGRSIGDFLADMTTPRRRRYFSGNSLPSTVELAEQWKRSAAADSASIQTGVTDTIPPFYRKGGSPYILDAMSDFKVVLRHVLKTYWGDKIVHIALLLRGILISALLGGLFFSLPTVSETAGDLTWISNRLSAVFFTFFLFSTTSFESLPFLIASRDVLHKQLDAKMLRPISYIFADNALMSVAIIPEVISVASIVFWMAEHVDREADDAMSVYGLVLAIGYALSFAVNSITRAIAYGSPDLVMAFLLHAMLIVGILYFFSGFFISEDTLPDWLVWLFWISPVSFAMRATGIVIFDSETFEDQGHLALELYEIRSNRNWVWIAIVYNVGVGLLAILVQWLLLRNKRFGNHRAHRAGGGPGWDEEEDMVIEEDLERSMSNGHDDRAAAAATALTASMPCPKVNFSFRDITYVVNPKSKTKRKKLLSNVSGHVTNGRMCAIIGATGAGKTTLLNQIALRTTSGERTGELLLHGRTVTDPRAFQRMLSFCEQEDHHCAFATVREATLFSARLRLPRDTEKSLMEATVDAILETLELSSIAHQMIGVKGHGGLSVGQFKRLTVAVELAANPAILFLDEPTSGLDATAAEVTMRAVRRVCEAGRTVLCTIHQPSREVFALFDDILLLQKGGRVAYHGPVSDLVAYFSRYEANTLSMPEGEFNPSLYALEVLELGQAVTQHAASMDGSSSSSSGSSSDGDEVYDQGAGAGVDWANLFHSSPEHAAILELIMADKSMAQTDGDAATESKANRELYVSTFVSTLAVWARWRTALWRTPEFSLGRFAALTILLLLFSLTLAQRTSLDSVAETQSYVGLIGFCLTLCCFLVALASLDIMSKMRAVYYREASNHMYSTLAHVTGSAMVDIVYLVISSLVAVAPLYLIVGLRSDVEGYVALVSIFFSSFVIFSFLAQLFVALMPNIRFAVLGLSLSVSVFVLFSGFFISAENAPEGFRWLFQVSPAFYMLEGLSQSQLWCNCVVDSAFNAIDDTCNGGQSCADVCDASLPGCNVLKVSLADGVYTRLNVWQFISTNFDYDGTAWEKNFGITFIFALVFKILEYISLRVFTHGKS